MHHLQSIMSCCLIKRVYQPVATWFIGWSDLIFVYCKGPIYGDGFGMTNEPILHCEWYYCCKATVSSLNVWPNMGVLMLYRVMLQLEVRWHIIVLSVNIRKARDVSVVDSSSCESVWSVKTALIVPHCSINVSKFPYTASVELKLCVIIDSSICSPWAVCYLACILYVTCYCMVHKR